MLGPAIGYSLASFCLKLYIAPTLTPTVTTSDPRWLGAWWLGWTILAGCLFIFASFLALFPKELPRAHARRQLKMQISEENGETQNELPTSFKGKKNIYRLSALLKCHVGCLSFSRRPSYHE